MDSSEILKEIVRVYPGETFDKARLKEILPTLPIIQDTKMSKSASLKYAGEVFEKLRSQKGSAVSPEYFRGGTYTHQILITLRLPGETYEALHKRHRAGIETRRAAYRAAYEQRVHEKTFEPRAKSEVATHPKVQAATKALLEAEDALIATSAALRDTRIREIDHLEKLRLAAGGHPHAVALYAQREREWSYRSHAGPLRRIYGMMGGLRDSLAKELTEEIENVQERLGDLEDNLYKQEFAGACFVNGVYRGTRREAAIRDEADAWKLTRDSTKSRGDGLEERISALVKDVDERREEYATARKRRKRTVNLYANRLIRDVVALEDIGI